MRDLTNIEAVAAYEPDYMGFIWVAKSPRYVGQDFVIPALPAKTKAVGVFVNEPSKISLNCLKRPDFRLCNCTAMRGKMRLMPCVLRV